ncbi:hypothetical protein SOVF_009920 [Spinacia oleracea]|nr:hypothetical protein SOVF_009920 [Spinacia oleracea]
MTGIEESDTGLPSPDKWDLKADRQMWERSLMVAKCTSIINPNAEEAKYAVNFVGRLAVELPLLEPEKYVIIVKGVYEL